MKQWLAIIVDDQQSSIDALTEKMHEIESVKVLKTFTDPIKALTFLRVNPIDLVFLDMELGKMTGFSFMNSMPRKHCKVIIFSAFAQFEDPGFERNVIDFLLKPVSQTRLKWSVQRLNENLLLNHPELTNLDSLDHCYNFFQVAGDRRNMRVMVHFKDIIYIRKVDRFVLIYQNDGLDPAISRKSFREIIDSLPMKYFIRCAQSTVFNINYFHSYIDQSIRLNHVKEPIWSGKLYKYPELREFLEINKI